MFKFCACPVHTRFSVCRMCNC